MISSASETQPMTEEEKEFIKLSRIVVAMKDDEKFLEAMNGLSKISKDLADLMIEIRRKNSPR